MTKKYLKEGLTFVLKQPKSESPTNIIALFYHHAKQVRIYTGLKITPLEWNAKTQTALTRGYPRNIPINDTLNRIKETVPAYYKGCIAKGLIPSDEELKNCIKPTAPETTQIEFWQAWQLYYEKKADGKAMRQKLDAIRKRLESFGQKRPLHLDRFNIEMMEDLAEHWTKQGLMAGTVSKHLAFFKSFLHWCIRREYTKNTRWQLFRIEAPPETLKIVLTKTELDSLRNMPMPQDYLRNCRDLFLIGCLTGLRFSDYTRIKPEHIKGNILVMRQQKTDGIVEIPLTEEAQSLVQGLVKGEIRIITNQKMNSYLKELCRACGIDELFEVHEYRGKAKTTKTLPKWQLIGTHTARRTFATNLLLNGIPAQVVMEYTGHKDYKSFAKYVNIPANSQHEAVRNALRLAI
jgi:site-specific recombinase XerD